jgi:5-methylcytosine-specific restriction endonuclease McrA
MAKLSEIDILAVGNTIQMVGAIWANDEKIYLCMFPEDKGDMPGKPLFVPGGYEVPQEERQAPIEVEVLNMDSGDWEKFLRQTDVLEAEVIARSSDGTLCKALLRKSQRQIAQAVSWNVFRRDKYACRYCGKDDVPLTVDHLVLWEDGGPSIEANLLSACRKCNKARGNTQYEQWLQHPRYREVSRGLTEEVRTANRHLVETLAGIPRNVHQMTR